MYIQLSLFDTEDPFTIAKNFIWKRYEFVAKSGYFREHGFREWLLSEFSSYSGGTAPQFLHDYGYHFYSFSPKGLELDTEGFKDKVLIPKEKLLRAYGIR